MKRNLVIVGLGGIGFRYDRGLTGGVPTQTHASAALKHSYFNLVAGVDFDESRRLEFKICLDLPAFESMLSLNESIREDIDCFIVSVATAEHLNVLQEVLSVRPDAWIMCEKPLCESLEQVEQLSQILDLNKLLVNYSRRFSRDIAKCGDIFKQAIAASLKDKKKITCKIYGGMKRTGSHFIDLTNLWFLQSYHHFNLAQLSKTKGGLIIKYPTVEVEFMDEDPGSSESFGILEFHSEATSVVFIRDELHFTSPFESFSLKVDVNQLDSLEAFKSLIVSDGTRNLCSYGDAQLVQVILALTEDKI